MKSAEVPLFNFFRDELIKVGRNCSDFKVTNNDTTRREKQKSLIIYKIIFHG